jgi:hypothetical protein
MTQATRREFEMLNIPLGNDPAPFILEPSGVKKINRSKKYTYEKFIEVETANELEIERAE